MEQTEIISLNEKKDFVVDSSNLKHVRTFCREVFERLNINQGLKDELILAIAEAAQNIVKHAYKNEKTEDKMEIQISVENGHLEIGFSDKGRLVEKEKLGIEKLTILSLADWELFLLNKLWMLLFLKKVANLGLIT